MSGCENSSRPKPKGSSKNIEGLYSELISIKEEYSSLKTQYFGLVKQNTELTERGEAEAVQIAELQRELERQKREEEKSRGNVKFMEQEMERIKKECVRMVETEKFKNKKLEETLQ
jgi:chromosome segregation ATPase